MAQSSYSQSVPSLFFRPPTLDDLDAIHAIEVLRFFKHTCCVEQHGSADGSSSGSRSSISSSNSRSGN
jgi:hypothetical protein